MKKKNYLASMAFTNTCKQRTVIRTSEPNAANLVRNKFANLQNKLEKYENLPICEILWGKKVSFDYLATISFSFSEAAPILFDAVATAIK